MNVGTFRNEFPVAVALAAIQLGEHLVEGHGGHYAYPPSLCKPYPPNRVPHHSVVRTEAETLTARHHLQRNLTTLRGEESVLAWTRRVGLTQTTIQRLINGTQDATTDNLQRIAEAVGLQPWQLIAPNLGEGMLEVRSTAGQTSVVPISARPRPMRQQSSPYAKASSKKPGEVG